MVNYQDYFEEALELFENDFQLHGNKKGIAEFLKHKYDINSSVDAIRSNLTRELSRHYADKEIVGENVRYRKEKQKAQDTNRIERKSFREHARLENALEEYAKAQLEIYKEHGEALKSIKLKPLSKSIKKNGVGVIHITDLHGNELVNLPHNQYDFNILAKRLKLYIDQCLFHFKSLNIEKVAMFFTGDLLNSDRRLDELLNASTNRAKATSLMRHILMQAILDVRKEGYPITVVSVMGNESRVGKEMPFSDEGLSDNYDFMIMDGIKQTLNFSKVKGISFGSIDKVEEVVEVDGNNWLLTHDVSKMTAQQSKTQSGIGRYSLNGVNLSFMIGGHLHSTQITNISARASSTVGSNSYNENALNLAGKAGQNYYTSIDGRINSTSVDLQDVDGVEGYEVISQLEAYNAKSANKLSEGTTVFRIVI